MNKCINWEYENLMLYSLFKYIRIKDKNYVDFTFF